MIRTIMSFTNKGHQLPGQVKLPRHAVRLAFELSKSASSQILCNRYLNLVSGMKSIIQPFIIQIIHNN